MPTPSPTARERDADSRRRDLSSETLVMRGSRTVVVRGSRVPAAPTERARLPSEIDRSREGQPLDAQDLRTIATRLTPARQPDPKRGELDPLSKADALKKAVKHARQLVRHEENGTLEKLWKKGKDIYHRLLGIPASSEPPARDLVERVISRNVSALRVHHERELKPVVDAVRAEYSGRTFVPGKGTPEVLKLAAIPLSKVGNVISMETLVLGISSMARRYEPDYVKVSKDLGPDRIRISRINDNGRREFLELSFRRPGKVDVVLNGQVVGNLWNDDALKAAEMFAQGRGFKMIRKKPEAHVVA